MADYENNNQTNKPTAESGAENQNIQNQNNFTERQNQAAFGEGYANPQQAAYYANPQAGTYFNPRQAQPSPQGAPDGNAYYAQPANRAHLKEMLILLSRQLIIRRPAFTPFNRLSKRQMCGMCCFRFSCRLQGLSFSL